jgi:MFS-type transporter involved in bile tolerance (Atg22 family)
VFHGNPEALAWALNDIGSYVSYIGVNVFLGTALLQLATQAAGCSTELIPGTNQLPNCDKRVHGIRPSSLLTTFAAILGVCSALLMPFVGAIVDFTPHRRLVGRITSFFTCALLLPQIFVNQHTWFAIAIIQFIGIFIGWGEQVAAYAYLPDLTNDSIILNGFIRTFTALTFSSMSLYLAITVALASALGIDNSDVDTAQLGMAIAFVITALTLGGAWGVLFEKRPAARILPPQKSLWTASFGQLYATTKNICKKYSALKWFYLSISMSDAAILSLASFLVTFFTNQLNMSASENGIAVLILLFASAPGAFLAAWFTAKFDPIRSAMMALFIAIVTTVVAAGVLKQPGQQGASYILSIGWGVAVGWKWTCDRFVAATIIPKGQDAELMGLYLSAGQILTWLPPLLYTVLNEAGVSQRISLGTLAVYWSLAWVCLSFFGSYDDALAVVSVSEPAADDEDDLEEVKEGPCDDGDV